MHELSIAHNLIEIAVEALAGHAVEHVQAVHVRIGALSGVDAAALAFCFEIAAEGTPLAGARLQIDHVPARIACPTCAAERILPAIQSLCCPVCGTPAARITGGRELEVTSLEYELPALDTADRIRP